MFYLVVISLPDFIFIAGLLNPYSQPVGVLVSTILPKDKTQDIIYNPWGGTKSPWLCYMAKLLLFCFVWLLSFVSAFSHSLIKFALWNSGKNSMPFQHFATLVFSYLVKSLLK